MLLFLIIGLMLVSAPPKAEWIIQKSGTAVRLRGVSAVNDRVAWICGQNGVYARTVDGGNTWQPGAVPGADQLDFRDVEAFDSTTAYLLSIGAGEQSRIYKTVDGGKKWALLFTNKDPKAFFDAIAFWDEKNGIALSDPVDGRFVIIKTEDGGKTWHRAAPESLPPALEGEAAFAASGTCLVVHGKTHAWFATGGARVSRVFRSTDRGRTWQVAETPIAAGNQSSGVFSVAFKNSSVGIAVGGDYRKENESVNNIALTRDGGQTWTLGPQSGLTGFRSAVAWIGGSDVVAVGPSGSDYSNNDGTRWVRVDSPGFHAFSFAKRGRMGWAAGESGRVARLVQ